MGCHLRHKTANASDAWFVRRPSPHSPRSDARSADRGIHPELSHQRSKGRDLFDLWLCLSRGLLDPDQVVACFAAYMKHEKHRISRAEFERNLFEKEGDRAFLDDIRPLLAAGIDYDAKMAMTLIREKLISRLAGEPWRGTQSSGEPKKRSGPRPGKGRRE